MDASAQPQQLRQQQQDQMPLAAPAPAAEADAAPTPAQQQANQQAGGATVQRMASQDTAAAAPASAGAAQAAAGPALAGPAAPDPTRPLKPGDVGRLTMPVKSPNAGPDGKFPMLPAGTIVMVYAIENGRLDVYQIGVGGAVPANGVQIPASEFRLEPDMMQNPAEGTLEGQAHYSKIKGDLWDPAVGPLPEQARHQGMAGDCYFISSMAAVCAQNPKQIEALFNVQPKAGEPAHKRYTVSLYQRDEGGTNLVRKSVQVDRWLPEADAGNAMGLPQGDLAYDGVVMPQTANAPPMKVPHMFFWAELLEKAFAQLYGSYNAIGSGGWPAAGLEALTGVPSTGEYSGNGNDLTPPPGMDVGTWALQKFTAYQKQNVAVVCGTLASWGSDKSVGPYGLYGSHAYQFERVEGTNLIFKNPWGIDDPQPVPAADFLTVFNDVGSNTGSIPKAAAAPAKAPTATAGSMAPAAAGAPKRADA